MSMKNSNDTIGNRTRDLPDCSTVPQSNALRRVPFVFISNCFLYHFCFVWVTKKQIWGVTVFSRFFFLVLGIGVLLPG